MTDEKDLIRDDIEAYLAKYRKKELLRFVSVGSVDDGKSTLIGRILYDTGMVFEDQMAAVRAASQTEEPDLALLTDGLKAEREQGITIDVAYRYFATDKRKFIIADTPGHIQYTRNMVTGASTADVALILIDARHGVLQQSRRHAYIASLLGIPHLAVCVNKMDLREYSQKVYEEISADFMEFGKTLRFKDIQFFPVSALVGDNVVSDSENTPWYDGPNVLGYLETVPVFEDRNFADFRYPVQYVIRPDLDYRGFAAEVAAGVIAKGDDVISLPTGKASKVKAIDTYDGELDEAFAGQSVTIRLEDEIDISRGDMIVKPDNLPRVTRRFDAHLVWMHERPLDTEKAYLVKHTTQTVRAQIDKIYCEIDMDTLEERVTDGIALNDIARVRLSCHRALYVDDYQRNRETGAFIVIDSLTNNTVAAGMISLEGADQDIGEVMKELHAESAMEPKTFVSNTERMERFGQRGATVWLQGLPGSGRWTLAYALERRLFDDGRTATVVNPVGEDLRSMISAAKAVTDAGLINICAFPSPTRTDRDKLKARIGEDRVIQVYVNTDEALCRERRPDADFSKFEAPEDPDITVALDEMRIDKAVEIIMEALRERGQFED
ncbi:MAG: sulfate adenylyltransferase subunit CysN [Deltaproteobacteria bacterium]|nr:sulfate adenylyltransferase subunit CysN [Deltaproteobacteria bacterium]NND29681.1 sulfate adenylyltransferase subunit CysN [Myxococcales bacterium]MBT8466064.1 sulfate adenylyltransferase subunit CysN [Deltaproteobacteria bacterium]MBT8483616.1 sulfate adenylyltransferase subunit CysN [Deltaproteobacteria bacterium]NNK09323.1 sulfate adenylyltransferase subunit CysN [Myxococcales bacterium]